MVKKYKILVPEPKSRFVRVQCPDCGNEQIIFDHATFTVRCLVCGRILAEPTGGKAKIYGKIIKILS